MLYIYKFVLINLQQNSFVARLSSYACIEKWKIGWSLKMMNYISKAVRLCERKTAFSISADDLLNYFLVRINFKDYFYISFSSVCQYAEQISLLTNPLHIVYDSIRRTVTKQLCPHSFPTVAIALFYAQFFAYQLLLDFLPATQILGAQYHDLLPWNTYESTSLCNMGMGLDGYTIFIRVGSVTVVLWCWYDVEYAAFSEVAPLARVA